MNDDLATVNVTYKGVNGDLPNKVPYSASDAEIKNWVTESLKNGELDGLQADPYANVSDFVVYRADNNRILVHLKTAFG